MARGCGGGVRLGLAATIAPMLFWSWSKRREGAAERFRKEHEAWLTRALLDGREYPRIPTRAVRAGGFDGLRRRAGGPQRAAMWWDAALLRVDEAPGRRRA